MSRDTNQNLYAEQIITESPFYYDEHGRLRVRVLQEEMDEQEKKLRAEFNEKEKGVMRTADFYTDPETGESMTRSEKAYRDFKKEKLAGGAKPDTKPAPEAKKTETPASAPAPAPEPEKKADGAAATTEKQPSSPLQRAREKMKDQLRRGKPGGGSNINKKPIRPYMPDPGMRDLPRPGTPPRKGGPVKPDPGMRGLPRPGARPRPAEPKYEPK